jgi:hypothetical protein
MEADARLAQTNEMMARITLVERFRQIGAMPIWESSGRMTILKAPANLDWDGLTKKLLETKDLKKPNFMPRSMIPSRPC